MLLWTLPSEKRPMKWSVELCSFTLAISFFQVSPAKSFFDSTASSTSFAPCEKTRPQPMALCPTSLLPMSASEGIPTAVPCALRRVVGHSLSRRSSTGVWALSTASPSVYLPKPTPSRMASTTGPRRGVKSGFFFKGSSMMKFLSIVSCGGLPCAEAGRRACCFHRTG